MKWWLFLVGDLPNCMNCKYKVVREPKWPELIKCNYHDTYAEVARKNESKCGLKGNHFKMINID